MRGLAMALSTSLATTNTTLFSSAAFQRSLSVRAFAGEERSFLQRHVKKAGAMLLLATTGVVVASALDDVLIYKQCSSKAMHLATQDTQLKHVLGDSIVRGWYKATIAVDDKGRSAFCSFPLSGSRGTANLRVRAVRSEEIGKWGSNFNFLAPGNWEILALEVSVPCKNGYTKEVGYINLMERSDTTKTSDDGRVNCTPCQVHSVHKA